VIDPIEPFRNLCEPVRDVGYEIITSSLRSKCRLFLAKSSSQTHISWTPFHFYDDGESMRLPPQPVIAFCFPIETLIDTYVSEGYSAFQRMLDDLPAISERPEGSREMRTVSVHSSDNLFGVEEKEVDADDVYDYLETNYFAETMAHLKRIGVRTFSPYDEDDVLEREVGRLQTKFSDLEASVCYARFVAPSTLSHSFLILEAHPRGRVDIGLRGYR